MPRLYAPPQNDFSKKFTLQYANTCTRRIICRHIVHISHIKYFSKDDVIQRASWKKGVAGIVVALTDLYFVKYALLDARVTKMLPERNEFGSTRHRLSIGCMIRTTSNWFVHFVLCVSFFYVWSRSTSMGFNSRLFLTRVKSQAQPTY